MFPTSKSNTADYSCQACIELTVLFRLCELYQERLNYLETTI